MENVNSTTSLRIDGERSRTINKKKVIFLVTQSEMGGAQRYIYEVARLLDKNRYEVLVAAGKGDGELFQKLQTIGVEFRQLKQMKRTPWPWQVILSVKEILGILKREKPNVLFLCSTTAGLLGSIARGLTSINMKEAKPRVIYRIGGWAFRDPRPLWQNQLILLLEKLTAPLKDLVIVNSEYDWRIAIEKKIVFSEKIIKIYNGLDPDSLDFLSKEEARLRLSLKHERLSLVGTVANFYKTKGLRYLIEAAHKLRGVGLPSMDVKFVIIGDGRERPKLEALIKKYGLEDKIILTGRISNAYRYLKAFDVFVLPSLKEGFPWIILEAMAAELPIVATRVGALPEIIENGKEGFLIEPKNSQALAEKIKWLLEHSQEAKVFGIQAKAKLVAKFSSQKMVEATEKLLS